MLIPATNPVGPAQFLQYPVAQPQLAFDVLQLLGRISRLVGGQVFLVVPLGVVVAQLRRRGLLLYFVEAELVQA